MFPPGWTAQGQIVGSRTDRTPNIRLDADLAEESASLQALQIKQQLGVQALAIANAGPQSILRLFQ